jgi:Zn-dependent protease
MAFRFTKGSLVVGSFRGAPIRIHWTTPIGIVAFTGWGFRPGAWLGFVLVILIHELGHAVMVRRAGQRTVAIDVHGFGGLCWWQGYPTPTQRALIAWGGVMAQALLGVVTLVVLAFTGPPAPAFAAQLVSAFLWPNASSILFNLLPMPPLDGSEAWKIVPILASRWRHRRDVAARARAAQRLQRELRPLEEPEELPPLPDEVKRVLDRVMKDGRAQHEAEKKTK